jgi:hypothetical protein
MKLKSLLFGSAAVLAAGTGAQAADLPTAEPVEYVRICDAFGTGFYYIPGTETCLKVGGRVRIEWGYVDDSDLNLDGQQSEFNNFATHARGYATFDARTQTNFGLVRSFLRLQGDIGFDNFSEPGNANYGDSAFNLDEAFIQVVNDWGTFTSGHTASFFDAPFSSNTFGVRISIDDPTTSQTLFAYTYSAGAFSASIAVEDPASSARRDDGAGPSDDSPGADDYEGQQWPDLVGNFRYTSGWGSALISGVVGEIHDVDGDGVGWAVNGGFAAQWGMFGGGLTAGYADGRLHYITNDRGGAGDFAGPDGSDTNQAWAIRGGVFANFTPTLQGLLDASYTDVFKTHQENRNYTEWDIAADLVWSPASGLSMGPEVSYRDLASDDDSEDQKAWSVAFRVQRDF